MSTQQPTSPSRLRGNGLRPRLTAGIVVLAATVTAALVPGRTADAATERVVISPDVKVVRHLQVSAPDCAVRLLAGLPGNRPEVVPAACAALALSSNPEPPSSLAGDGWSRFVGSREFRGFVHIPQMRLTCRDGRVSRTTRNAADGVFGASEGWTPVTRRGPGFAKKGEWYEEDRRFKPDLDDEEIRRLQGNAGVVVSLRQASRISEPARSGQYGTLGYDAPFIWSAAHVVLRCDGSVRVVYGGSSVPGAQLYLDDRGASSIRQDDDLAGFVRAGGRLLHRNGRGNLFEPCEIRQVDAATRVEDRALTSCERLKDDAGLLDLRTT